MVAWTDLPASHFRERFAGLRYSYASTVRRARQRLDRSRSGCWVQASNCRGSAASLTPVGSLRQGPPHPASGLCSPNTHASSANLADRFDQRQLSFVDQAAMASQRRNYSRYSVLCVAWNRCSAQVVALVPTRVDISPPLCLSGRACTAELRPARGAYFAPENEFYSAILCLALPVVVRCDWLGLAITDRSNQVFRIAQVIDQVFPERIGPRL